MQDCGNSIADAQKLPEFVNSLRPSEAYMRQ